MNQENFLVCVTQQKACERLIQKAVELMKDKEGDLYVLHVTKTGWKFLDTHHEGEALQYLFNASKSVGANLTVLKSDDVIETISKFAGENKIKYLIMGQSAEDDNNGKFYQYMKSHLKNVEITVVPSDSLVMNKSVKTNR